MKKVLFIFYTLAILITSCRILGSERTTHPDILVSPSTIVAGQEVEIKISSSKDFIMPTCNGITFQIEKFESGSWEFIDGQNGPCLLILQPEVPISEPIIINHTINKEGIYRFVSTYKFNSDDELVPLYSDQFIVRQIPK